MTFEYIDGLYYDGEKWYKPFIQDGKTILAALSDDEAAEIMKGKDLHYGEVPN